LKTISELMALIYRVSSSAQAKFFKLDETEIQAQRIAEKFRHEFAEHPAARDAIGILAEEAGVYLVKRR
jgi:hypothetical protein